MKRSGLLAVVLLGLVLGMSGCQTKSRDEVTEAPPLAPAADPAPEFRPAPEPRPVERPVMIEPRPLPPAPAPAPAARATHGAPIPPGAQTHVVQRGETLWSIANRYYGDPRKVNDIARANNITDVNKIQVGQTLVLP